MTEAIRSLRSPVGLPDYLEDRHRRATVTCLRDLWTATVGQGPGDLSADLALCRRWFDPVAQGQRLRKELAELPAMPPDWPDPGAPLTLRIDEGQFLVTPEGRCALDLLEALPARSLHIIDEGSLARYDRELAVLYRDWGRHRLHSVVDLLRGTTKPLQIPAAGVLVALLVNRCTNEPRALTRFAAGQRRDIVDRAFFTPVQAFKAVLSPGGKGAASPKLISGWMLYEAKRRVGEGLVIDDAKSGKDGQVWIRSEAVPQVIDLIARDLQRGHRSRPAHETLGEAFDALVASLRDELPALAAFGLVHERPTETRRLRGQLMDAFARASE